MATLVSNPFSHVSLNKQRDLLYIDHSKFTTASGWARPCPEVSDCRALSLSPEVLMTWLDFILDNMYMSIEVTLEDHV